MCKPAIIKTIFKGNKKFYKILKPYTKEVTERVYDTTITKIVTAYKELVIPASYYNSL